MGMELDKTFNVHKGKKREGDLACAELMYMMSKTVRNKNPHTRIPQKPGGVQRGITLSLPVIDRGKEGFQVRLKMCGLLMWQGSTYINTLSDSRSQINGHRSIGVDPENLQEPCRFWFKCTFKAFVIFEYFLTNLVVKN